MTELYDGRYELVPYDEYPMPLTRDHVIALTDESDKDGYPIPAEPLSAAQVSDRVLEEILELAEDTYKSLSDTHEFKAYEAATAFVCRNELQARGVLADA